MTKTKPDDASGLPMPPSMEQPDPGAIHVDQAPLPDQTSESRTEAADEPIARTRKVEREEKPTDGVRGDRPAHHTGRMPPTVTPGEL